MTTMQTVNNNPWTDNMHQIESTLYCVTPGVILQLVTTTTSYISLLISTLWLSDTTNLLHSSKILTNDSKMDEQIG